MKRKDLRNSKKVEELPKKRKKLKNGELRLPRRD
jgi:hypothetical protein